MPGVDEGEVVVFGAGGPWGAVAYPDLAEQYTLRLADLASVDEVLDRESGEHWPGWTDPPEAPDRWVQCDVTDYDQVLAATRGCDAAINLTVDRTDPAEAFPVNVVGVYNVLKAAVEADLDRVITTGPHGRRFGYEGDTRYEYDVPADAPFRPGTDLYPHTKHLGYEVADAFAEAGLDVLTLLVSRLRPSDAYDGRDDDVMMGFTTAWEDLGAPLVRALEAPPMPRPNERFHICSDLPIGRFSPEKAKRLLDWEPTATFEEFYTRGCRSEERANDGGGGTDG
jgi:hypothetical protein